MGTPAPAHEPVGLGPSGGWDARSGPLRPGDPARVGDYHLVALLGEGGMGRVYLARSPAGRLVAVKLIRTDIAGREAFRRRFRGEVDRARQVPPFCTAEVLDADPDHDPPYLVVEYVDGPDLATVVRERGPLSPANLHGLAIGVATALTAIHGAGVIHRDLKAANVLLAPGSPKVIDFGLAREADIHHATGDTSTGEVVGTVAYMAPEQIEPAGRALTPAADIFSWGSVIAFAGTGKVPFAADSLPALAARILTEAPDLDGLSGPLRGLVEQALTKDPDDRPTARELLDRLLTARVGAAAAPAGSAELLRNGRRYAKVDPDDAGEATVAYRVRGARRPRTLLLSMVALAVVGLVGAAAAVALPFDTVAGPTGQAPPPPTIPTTAPDTTPRFRFPPEFQPVVRDPLTAPGRWQEGTFAPGTSCVFAGALMVTSRIPSYRCRGPADELSDVAIAVDVTLVEPGSCATIWFRFTVAEGGYAVRVCEEAFYLVTHGTPEPETVRTLREFWLDAPVTGPVRVGIIAEGEELRLYRDQLLVDTWSDGTFARGRVGLGVLQMRAEVRPPYRASFANIEVRGGGG